MKKEMKDEMYSFMMSISLLLFGVDIFVVEVARERVDIYKVAAVQEEMTSEDGRMYTARQKKHEK